MRRVTAAGVRETNIKCEVVHEVKGDQTPPTVQVTFSKILIIVCCGSSVSLHIVDGSELLLEGGSNTALDMIAAINSKSRTL